MKRFWGIFVLVVVLLTVAPYATTEAQCAMCTLTAENAASHGNTEGKGLNNGILFLLAMPYLAALAIGVLWYKKYRSKKNVKVDDKPIVLN